MSGDQIRRTWTLLDTLLDYLPGPSMQRPASDSLPQRESELTRPRVYSPAETSAQIAHLEHQARLRRGDYGREAESWERARREQYREGDYAALDLALADLEAVNGVWGSLAWRVASHHPGVLDLALRVELVCTIRWLAGRLPDPAKVPAWTASSAPPSVAHLAALRDLGVPMRVMQRVYGIHASTIQRRTKTGVA